MHVEPLEKLPRSVREFLSHYAMIVLSILTALALEQVALRPRAPPRRRARQGGDRAGDRVQPPAVAGVAAGHRENAKAWEALLARTVAGGPGRQQHEREPRRDAARGRPQFRDALPSLKTTAWDAAIVGPFGQLPRRTRI